MVKKYIYYSDIKKEWNIFTCDNTDGSRGYYVKWNKSDRERWIYTIWLHLYVEPKKNKQAKKNVKRLIDTENKLIVARVKEVEIWVKSVKGIKMYKLSVTK